MPKRKPLTAKQREQARLTAKTLERTGYAALKAKHGRVRLHTLPDLKEPERGAPMSNTIDGVKVLPARPPLPKDANKYPISHLHKQGYTYFSIEDLMWAGGKKP